MKFLLPLISFTLLSLVGAGQVKDELESTLTNLYGESENIIKDNAVKNLLSAGTKLLPVLSTRFTDNTISKVYSTCAGRYLTRGELAIIVADHIEGMPYFQLTGLQNCTLESCPNNPNFVEYYLEFLRFRGMYKVFQKKYEEWLQSADRKKWHPQQVN